MNPDESVKQKLERYQRTQELTNQIRFNQASRPYSKAAEEPTTQPMTSRLIQAQAAIDRNDMEFVRSYIRTLSEIDPANPYYTNLLKRDFIPWDEFQEIVSNFSTNHSYLVRMQVEITKLRQAAEREGEPAEEAPETGQETGQPAISQPEGEERQEETQQFQGQEESSSGSQQRQAPRTPPRRVIAQPREKKSAEEKSIDRHNRKMEKRKPENIEERKKSRKERRRARRARNKFNDSRLGRGLTRANNILNAPNRLLDKSGERFANSRLGRGLARINFLLGAPGRFLNKFLSNLGNRFANRFLNNRFGRGLGRLGRGLNTLDKFLNPVEHFVDKMIEKLASRLGRLAWQGAKLAAQLAMQAARFLANLAARALSQLAAQAAGGVARTALGVAGRGALLILANPIAWIIIGIIGVLFLFVWWYSDAYGECGKPGVVEMTKSTNKEAVSVDENIEFKINVVYKIKCPRAYASAVVRDTIPANTTYVPGSAKHFLPLLGGIGDFSTQMSEGKLDGNTIVWQLNDLAPNETNTLTFSITPTETDVWIANTATIGYQVYNGGLPNFVGEGFPPTQDNCGGKYSLADIFGTKNPLGNFGDPACNFKKDDLYTQLKQQDPTNADLWFYQVARCESSYNPNDWRDPNLIPKTPDPAGAWGLFQMGRGRNGQYDHGDMPWQQQIINAINYAKLIPSIGAYWPTVAGC